MPIAANLAAAARAIDNKLMRILNPSQARLMTLRVIASRLGELDVWARWDSAIWKSGDLVLKPIFSSTWPKQRVALAVAAAAAAEQQQWGNGAATRLHRFDPAFDSALARAMAIADQDLFRAVCEVVDGIAWPTIVDLQALSNLDALRDNDKGHQITELTALLSRSSKTEGWVEGRLL